MVYTILQYCDKHERNYTSAIPCKDCAAEDRGPLYCCNKCCLAYRSLDTNPKCPGCKTPVTAKITGPKLGVAVRVSAPPHYNHGTIQPYDVIDDWGLDYYAGSAVKYICRAGHKENEVLDLKKAVEFLTRKIGKLENE